MRQNRIKKIIAADQVAKCFKLNTSDSRVAELVASQGVDAVWLDMEHVPNSICDIENQIRAAKLHDVDAIVRVQRGGYSSLIQPLEAGCSAIMVPHVMDEIDAADIVRQTKFHPLGLRPIDGGNVDNNFGSGKAETYTQQANDETLVIVQIEDISAVERIEKIVAVDGVAGVFFGPADLAHAFGVPGDYFDKRVLKAREYVAKVTRAAGKFAGTPALGESDILGLIQMGYRLLGIGSDTSMLRMAIGEKLKKVDSFIEIASGNKRCSESVIQ